MGGSEEARKRRSVPAGMRRTGRIRAVPLARWWFDANMQWCPWIEFKFPAGARAWLGRWW